jgi:predicted dehydrogenase
VIRVVLCGYGRFGRVYARRVQEHPDLELVGVVEVGAVQDAVRAAGLRPFDTLSEAIDTVHARLVIVATPPAMHAVLGIYALNRHCDVLLAKPGALGIDQADRITATAWQRHRSVVVDYTPTMSPAWAQIRALPWSDGILTVRMVRRGVQAYQDCGALWDLAPHDVALALELMPEDRVVGVTARAWWYPACDEPVGAWLHLTHQSGRTTRIEVDWMAAATERRVEIVEHERMVVWDQMADTWGWTRRGYRCDDRGDVRGVWDLEPQLSGVVGGPDHVTRALSRVVRVIGGEADDSHRLLEVTRILDRAEESIYSDDAGTVTLAA